MNGALSVNKTSKYPDLIYRKNFQGGLFLMINYAVHMLVIGLALGYTIRHKVPNTIKGVSISNPSIEVQVTFFLPSLNKDRFKTGFNIALRKTSGFEMSHFLT